MLWPNSWKLRICLAILYFAGLYACAQSVPTVLDSLILKFAQPTMSELNLGTLSKNSSENSFFRLRHKNSSYHFEEIIGSSNSITQDIKNNDKTIKQLPTASTLLEYPEKIQLHDSSVVKLTLGKKEIIQALKSKVESPQKYVVDTTKITAIMSAKLTGNGFDISPSDAVEQAVSLETPTEWDWDIEAKGVGKQKLKLELDVLIPIGKQNTHKHITTLVRNVEVDVTLMQWAEQSGEQLANFLNNWKDIIGIVLLALGLINRNRLLKWFRNITKNKNTKLIDQDFAE